MPKIDAILFPVDFSERAAAAAPHARALARLFEARTVLLHVVPEAPQDYARIEAMYRTPAVWPRQQELEAGGARKLREFAGRHGFGLGAEQRIASGDAAGRILEAARRFSSPLFVMPTHGYGPFRRFVLGSVAAKVLHDAAGPVFTGAHLPEPSKPFDGGYRHVACAIGLRDRPRAVELLRWAAEFARLGGASLSVLHVVQPRQIHGLYRGLLSEEVFHALSENVRKELAAVVAEAGCETEIRIGEQDLSGYISAQLEALSAGLLIIGRSSSRRGVGRLRTRAYQLIRESPVPVVSV